MIENENDEITLILHSGKEEDKKMRAFVETISMYTVKTLDLKSDSLTETQLAEIADKMCVSIHDLLDDSYSNASGNDKGIRDLKAMSKADILTLIIQNPLFLTTPILIIGKKAYSYGSAFEMLKESFNVDGVAAISSANVEEKRYNIL
jgi:arsenate reductase-like glutaredoxin family protein